MQVTNICAGMSPQSRLFTWASVVAGREELRRGRAQQRVRARHHERSRHALVGDVADHDHHPAVGQLDEVVEVAADLACRPVEGGDLEAGQLGQRLRQELLLDELGNDQLLLHALPAPRLVLLLLDELAHPHRRRGVAGERVEELPVVGRVTALGQSRTEREQADQLTGRDERHRHHHAGRAHLVERGRLELQRGDVDGARGALEVGEERVVRRDLELLRGRRRRARDLGLRAAGSLLRRSQGPRRG